MIAKPAPQIWETALGELQIEVNKSNFQTWLRGTTGLSFEDGTFVVGVPNTFVAEYLEKNLYSLIEKVLTGITRSKIKVNFCVGEREVKPPKQQKNLPLFNPKYTFDSFIVGRSNQMAYAAALQVVEKPGQAYNPLFIHGAPGLGKTHLLHAIGHAAVTRGLAVLYVSAEQFTNELVSAIREDRTVEFRNKYRDVDMLLVDDIQFFGGKERTKENFFYTFNELHANNRQIALTSDCLPREIPQLRERLRSRFEWGLVADLQPPDFEIYCTAD
jgi:chromosomal replication initiator protein